MFYFSLLSDLRGVDRWKKRSTFSVFLEVTNLFDRLNPLRVQPRTGEVWDDGKSTLFGSGVDFKHDPSDVGAPRIIKVGVTVAR